MTISRAIALLVLIGMGTALTGILAALPAAGDPPPRPSQSPQLPPVPNSDCAICHEDLVKAFDKNPHSTLEKSPRFNLKDSCESCHGPGQAHIDGGGDVTKIITFSGDAQSTYTRQCLNCHRTSRHINGYLNSTHAKQGLSCADCHSVHASAFSTPLLKQPSNPLCFSCHSERKADFARPYHHRVPENAMTCTDCHQPHGGLDRAMLQASFSGDEPCFSCHKDKEGPFVFEHAGLAIRDCQACHQPHGSNNPRMLVRPTVAQLCLECHSATQNALTAQPPSFHDIRSPRYQSCTTCHVAIHGSNASPTFMR
jgi:DmsE family decaheme c-type cytochrome